MRKHRIYRQGDLILIEENDVPLEYMDKESNRLEISSENGNKHELSCKVYRWNNTRYVLIDSVEVLKHPQHPWLAIEPGIYRVTFVRDYVLERAID